VTASRKPSTPPGETPKLCDKAVFRSGGRALGGHTPDTAPPGGGAAAVSRICTGPEAARTPTAGLPALCGGVVVVAVPSLGDLRIRERQA
jgi:hypothetical protein